ncbi:MAG: hypothetical protein LBF77_06145 [Spirochaetaceae bacterium]|jgi:hypothetical protein|nr:hypothetical protein [Spirochaetaceae bacterium]
MTQAEKSEFITRLSGIGTLVMSIATYDKEAVMAVLDEIQWLQSGIENGTLGCREAGK